MGATVKTDYIGGGGRVVISGTPAEVHEALEALFREKPVEGYGTRIESDVYRHTSDRTVTVRYYSAD